MAKLSRALIQLVSVNDIKVIETLDKPKLSSSSSFVEDNLLGYYTIINTWLLIIKQVSEYGWKFVLTHLLKCGLIQTIREFDSAADEIVHGVVATEITFSIARTLMADIERSVPILGVPIDTGRELVTDPMAAALAIFRYPKRFSPIGADKLKETSIQGFLDTQKRLKLEQRRSHSRFIVPYVREALLNTLNWDKLCDELDNVNIDDIIFTPGVSFDTNSSLVSKLQSISREHVEYFYQPFGIPVVANQGVEEPRYDERGFAIHEVRLVVVPKNYKTGRVIAPENVYRQALARRYFVIADRYLPETVRLHDQSQNQRLAYEGSLDGKLSTLDLHAASDSITPTLLREIFPSRFVDIMGRILPNRFVLDGKSRLLHSAATMGNSMTFWLESVVFLSISVAAVNYYNRLAGECDDRISVYGDDIIVPTGAAPLVMEWLEALGFIVNHEKSFFSEDNRYRESCGEEYFKGTNVSSRYFPRFPIEGTLGGKVSGRQVRDGFTGTVVDTMSSLVDLQHKLFLWCVPAAMLVEEIIMDADRRMTSSTPDMENNDLYSYESYPVNVPAPSGEWVDGKLMKSSNPLYPREAHLGPITVYKEATKAPTEFDAMLVALYNYQQFLKFGPRYEDELSRLLNLSSPPTSIQEASGTPAVKWVLIK
jgi:hypothetical protein